MSMSTAYIDAIRRFEGFTAQAQWDYAQFTNGYGTRAAYPGEVIDRAEAERRFAAEIGAARAIVERTAPAVDEGTKAALTSLTFNAGTAWTRSGLGEAVRRGDLDAARALLQRYNKAGGETLPGLVKRRLEEASWIGSGEIPSREIASVSPGPQAIVPPNEGQRLGGQHSPTGAHHAAAADLRAPVSPPESAVIAASGDRGMSRTTPRDPRELAILLLALSGLEEPRSAGKRPEEAA
jgi:GH24 family phage-related lysozyme (muramidase)